MRVGKAALVLMASAMLCACTGDKSVKVTSLQKKDKSLSCSQVMLEINEAEFYRKAAEKNKSPKLKTLIMPIGYVSTYMDAEDAIDNADERIDYLNRIYDIMKCDEMEAKGLTAMVPSPVSYQPQNNMAHSSYIVAPEYNDEHIDSIYWE